LDKYKKTKKVYAKVRVGLWVCFSMYVVINGHTL